MCGLLRATLAVVALSLVPAVAQAAPIVGGREVYTINNFQSVELFPGTPFNPGPVPFTVVLSASGQLGVDRNTQVGNTITGTNPFVQLTGAFPAPLPPIPFTILAGANFGLPGIPFTISNVVQNPADPGFAAGALSSFAGGNFANAGMFIQVLPDGTTLYSDPAAPTVFTAALTTLPYPAGTTFVSPAPVNLYVQTGPGFDTARDPAIGRSFNRSVVITGQVVPEPMSVLVFGAAAAGAVRLVRRRVRV